MSKPSKRPNREERKAHKKTFSCTKIAARATEKRRYLSDPNRCFQYGQERRLLEMALRDKK